MKIIKSDYIYIDNCDSQYKKYILKCNQIVTNIQNNNVINNSRYNFFGRLK